MEMLTKNIVMSGSCCQKNDDGSNKNNSAVSDAYLNNEMLNSVDWQGRIFPCSSSAQQWNREHLWHAVLCSVS